MSVEHLKQVQASESNKLKKSLWYIIPIVLLLSLLLVLLFNYQDGISFENIVKGVDSDFAIFLLIGIFAQLVDNTLGMGYGATSSSFLLSFGVSPAISSMGVHVAQIFTSGASAISHYKFKNINKKLVRNLVLPGMFGAFLGAYLLSVEIDGDVIKPFIAGYMFILAVMIIIKGLKQNIKKRKTKKLGYLATFGGFMDSVGGGGWGPIVTSTLMGRGRNARYTIGSVNTAEFAVAFTSGITFIVFEGIEGWKVISGLIIGGIIGAPLGAYLLNKIPRKQATVLIGLLLIFLSIRTIVKSFM
ncbi:MAG: sulfite exporter TauE/SafE family protein [Flavobacteriales bacterium]|nr:sulfite exporter TauE/SafE family protein [Flavobacteriales bacterium]